MVTCFMQVIARRTLRKFWAHHPHAEGPIRSRSQQKHDGKVRLRSSGKFGGTVDFVGDNRVIFDLGGNKSRLIVHTSISFGRVVVKFIGTHSEYDRIDPETVSWRRK